MRMMITALLACALAVPAGAATAPRVPIASFEQLAKPLPLPYDEQADAQKQVAAAKARAKARHKLLVIDLGGNWCLDCRLLAGTMDVPQLQKFVAAKYEVAIVDVGRFDKNLDIPAHYGIRGRMEGVPSLLIVDPRTDKLINQGHTAALADARSMTPQALAGWLAGWTK